MKGISADTSGKITFWSFVLSVAVVVIHCAWSAETPIGRLVLVLTRDTLARLAVPFFFACSGYFLARHFDERGWWRREAGKRCLSLGVPYLLWTLVLAVVLFVETREITGVGGLGLNLCKMPAVGPLWYVRALLVFVFLSPVFRPAVELRRPWAPLAAYILLLAFSAAFRIWGLSDEQGVGGFFCYGFPLEGLVYFLAGACLCRGRLHLPSARMRPFWLTVGVALLLLRLTLAHFRIDPIVDVRCAVTPVLLLALWCAGTPPKLPAFLTGCAFPIYLMHAIVIVALRNGGGTYRPCNPWLEFALGVLIPILAVHILRRYAPRVARILFGGRT